MKVVLLAGGFGTRLSEYTDIIPKPMVEIHGKPILLHIVDIYNKFNHKEFYVALGYKSDVIKKFFQKNFISCDSSKTKYYLDKEKINSHESTYVIGYIKKILLETCLVNYLNGLEIDG